MYRRMRRLICFDMDSTLIQTECIDELAKRAGVGDQVSAITASAMRGEIDFKESFTRRVALLKGLDASVMKDIADHLPITEACRQGDEACSRPADIRLPSSREDSHISDSSCSASTASTTSTPMNLRSVRTASSRTLSR